MKLLFDQNLSPELPRLLADIFPGSSHTETCGLGAAGDNAIWAYAATEGYLIVSKDRDFHAKSLLKGAPPQVVWLRVGNCPTTVVAKLLRTHSVALHSLGVTPTEALLILEKP